MNAKFELSLLSEKMIRYVDMKNVAVDVLTNHFGVCKNKLFYKYLHNEIEVAGKTDSGFRFMFHGYGCTVVDANRSWEVELEFGPKGNANSFDRYTLGHYLGVATDENSELIEFLENNGLISLVDVKLRDKVEFGAKKWESEEEEIDSCVSDRYMFLR